MMKVEDFTSIHPRSFRHCSFEIKKGEILGVAGIAGCGQKANDNGTTAAGGNTPACGRSALKATGSAT